MSSTLLATQARFSQQEVDAAYKQLAAHGMVTNSTRPGGAHQLSDRFMMLLQVLMLPLAEHTIAVSSLQFGRVTATRA